VCLDTKSGLELRENGILAMAVFNWLLAPHEDYAVAIDAELASRVGQLRMRLLQLAHHPSALGYPHSTPASTAMVRVSRTGRGSYAGALARRTAWSLVGVDAISRRRRTTMTRRH
jgi:hypothetical protein